jgi:hypothetical protein
MIAAMPSHDQNFKNLILDYPREALAFLAAEEARAIDAGCRIIPVREEQLKERLGERFRELDVALQVEWSDGRREAVVFLIEQTSEIRRFNIHRLAHYCLDLSELLNLTAIVPVVVFLQPGKVQETLCLGSEQRRFLDFSYLAVHLSRLSAQDYLDSPNLFARLNLPNMAYPPEQRVDVYASACRGLAELEPDTERQLKYIDFIDIYADLSPEEQDDYRRRYPKENQSMMTFSQRFTQQGRQQGRQEGRQEGEVALLARQLARRFGNPLPAWVAERMHSANDEQLLLWGERVLDATCLDDVFSAPH